jgi:hypothetical protein
MKKSILAIGVGVFVVVTILLCINNDEKMYQKKKHFDTVNDVLLQLENNEIRKISDTGRREETDEFLECLSKRKRLTDSQMDFKNLKINKVKELNDEEKKALIEDYNKIQMKLNMPYKATKIEPVRLEAEEIFPYKDENGEISKKECDIDFVMVDEGEGMVIDYYVEGIDKNSDKKEGNMHAKG